MDGYRPGTLTVAVCTCGSDDMLRKCLRMVADECLATKGARLILVINGTGDTNVARGALSGLTRAQREIMGGILHEPTLGLSYARNRALRECQTPYLAFLDDDAYPAPGWIAGLLRGFRQHSAVCLGGKAELIWPAQKPVWVTRNLAAYFSELNWGETELDLRKRPELWLAGTNIAFDAEALRTIGGFPTCLGRVGNRLLSGEETYVIRVLCRMNLPVWYCPWASVFHQVRPERVARRWLLSRAYWGGVSDRGISMLMDERFDGFPQFWRLARSSVSCILRRVTPTELLTHAAFVLGQTKGVVSINRAGETATGHAGVKRNCHPGVREHEYL